MSRKNLFLFTVFAFTLLLTANQAVAQEVPTTEEKLAALEANCAKTSAERAERQNEKSLYERLGGYEKIHDLTKEIVRLHLINEDIKHMFVNVDKDVFIKRVADFVAAGTGGTTEYTGRTLPASHEQLKLTDEDFLSAGADIVKAMQNKGYSQEEIDEMLCILMSLKDQVVLKQE